MKIYLNIEADSTAEILEAFRELAATGAIVQAKPVETKKRKPAASQTPETDPVVEDTQPTDDTPPAEEETEPKQETPAQDVSADNANIPTVVDLRAAAQEKGGNTLEGKKVIKGLLNQFGSKSISDLPADKRAAFLAALEEI